jgi:hypothetical protein
MRNSVSLTQQVAGNGTINGAPSVQRFIRATGIGLRRPCRVCALLRPHGAMVLATHQPCAAVGNRATHGRHDDHSRPPEARPGGGSAALSVWRNLVRLARPARACERRCMPRRSRAHRAG